MQKNEVLSKIESMMPFFSSKEKKLGKYILEHSSEVTILSTQTLSKLCDVSEPTLIRFTRKLGYSGYREFKLKLTAEYVSDPISGTLINMDSHDSPKDIYLKLASFTISSIKSTSSTLEDDSLSKAVDCIYQAAQNNKQIFLSGMGASSLMAESFQVKLMRLNINSVFYSDMHLRLEACTNLQKDDLFICFSALGSSKENYEMIEIAKNRGAKVLSITQYGCTKLAKNSDIVLYTSVIENNLRLASQTSTVIHTMIEDTIFLALAMKDYDNMSHNVKETREIFHKLGHTIITSK